MNLISIMKILVFASFIFTVAVMLKLGNKETGMLILFAAALYIIFNKLDDLAKRIEQLNNKKR